MDGNAIPLSQLDVVGYADVLPAGHGPVVVPPVFCTRTEPARYHVPPFQIAGNWLLDPQVISRNEADELACQGELTLPDGFRREAQPDHRLWVDLDGILRYEPALVVGQQLQARFRQQLDIAEAALRAGELERAEKAAGIALAAQDRAVEPMALLAACHALRGEGAEVALMKESAEQAGHSSARFLKQVEGYLEAMSPPAWRHFLPELPEIRLACDGVGITAWVSFEFSEEDYRHLVPLLHHFHRRGNEREVIVSCTDVEADILADWPVLSVAYNYAEAQMRHGRASAVLTVAAKAMLYESDAIVSSCQRELKCSVAMDTVRVLGDKVRRRLSSQLVGAPHH